MRSSLANTIIINQTDAYEIYFLRINTVRKSSSFKIIAEQMVMNNIISMNYLSTDLIELLTVSLSSFSYFKNFAKDVVYIWTLKND